MAEPTVYATTAELAAYAGSYTLPADDGAALLRDASRLLDAYTLHRAVGEWADPLPDPLTDGQSALRDATLAQVEFWLEVGAEEAILPTAGETSVGALSVGPLPRIAPKAKTELRRAGLLYRAVEVVG